MVIEAAIVAATKIFLHPKSGERDTKNGVVILELLHDLNPSAVRQADVAYQNIEMLVRRHFQGRLDAVRRLDVVPPPAEKLRQRTIRIFVILDEKNAERLVRRRNWGRGGLLPLDH